MTDSLYLKQMEVGPMANFLYLVGDNLKKEVLIVDPAWQIDTVFKTVEREGLSVRGAILTHGHFDHCNGIEELLARVDVPIYVQKEEVQFVKSMEDSKSLFGVFPEENLKAVGPGEIIRIGDIELTLLHTPGHTPGSQCFLIKNTLISGDTLFIRSCGRCDLPGSDPEQMYDSLTRKLMRLPDDTILYPGHNYSDHPASTMQEEKKKNPYLMCGSLQSFLSLAG